MKCGTGQSYRPSPHELNNKLTEVRKLLAEGKWRPGDPAGLEGDFEKLDESFGIECETFEQRTQILLDAANEVVPEHYDGRRPPEKAYKEAIKGEPLYAFCWKSTRFGAQMYFKFALKGRDNNRKAYPVSIHESRY